MSKPWLTSLKTETPQAGWELAIRLPRLSVKVTQPSGEIRGTLRTAYDQEAAQLTAPSQGVATNLQTTTTANN